MEVDKSFQVEYFNEVTRRKVRHCAECGVCGTVGLVITVIANYRCHTLTVIHWLSYTVIQTPCNCDQQNMAGGVICILSIGPGMDPATHNTTRDTALLDTSLGKCSNHFQCSEKAPADDWPLWRNFVDITRSRVTLHSGRMAGHTRYRYFVYYPYRYFIACSGVSLARVGKLKVQVV